MAFEMAQTDKNICVHDRMANQCCFAVFSVDNRNLNFIGSSQSISDDNLASCGNGIESVQICAVKVLQGIFLLPGYNVLQSVRNGRPPCSLQRSATTFA